jgi:hypothetical protein
MLFTGCTLLAPVTSIESAEEYMDKDKIEKAIEVYEVLIAEDEDLLDVIDDYNNLVEDLADEDVAELDPLDEIVIFPDAGLDQGIRETLQKIGELVPTELTRRDVLKITELRLLTFPWPDDYESIIIDSEISNLSGLSELTNLTSLSLDSNNVSDISSLSELTNLIHIGLRDNNISDISELSELTNLFRLKLSSNNISDISALSELMNLTELYLGDNNINDTP